MCGSLVRIRSNAHSEIVLDVLLREAPEQPLLPGPAHVVARGALGVVEDPEVDAGRPAAAAPAPACCAGCAGRGSRSRRRTRARRPAPCGRRAPRIELARPARPLAARLAERVAGRRDRLERVLQAVVQFALLDSPRRSRLMIGTCSMPTGQISTQAMHCMHDQACRDAIPGAPRPAASRRAAGRGRGPAATAAARRPWPGRPRGTGRSACTSRGRSGAAAGSRRTSRTRPPGSAGQGAADGGVAHRHARRAGSMCSAFVRGIAATNDSATMPCTHHVTWRSDSAVAGASPAACRPLPAR